MDNTLTGSQTVKDFTDGAVKMLDETTKYLRDTQPRDMLGDFQTQAKANPIAFLIGALAVGFLAGKMLRRS